LLFLDHILKSNSFSCFGKPDDPASQSSIALEALHDHNLKWLPGQSGKLHFKMQQQVPFHPIIAYIAKTMIVELLAS
jgi:hypothetical protein